MTIRAIGPQASAAGEFADIVRRYPNGGDVTGPIVVQRGLFDKRPDDSIIA